MNTGTGMGLLDSATSSSGITIWVAPPICGAVHAWVCESLRGTNRNQRVETIRCEHCGERERRVWTGLPHARRPSKVTALEPARPQIMFSTSRTAA